MLVQNILAVLQICLTLDGNIAIQDKTKLPLGKIVVKSWLTFWPFENCFEELIFIPFEFLTSSSHGWSDVRGILG